MASPYQALAPSSHSSTRPDFTPNLPSKRAEKSTIGKHLQTPDFSQSFDIKQLRKRLSRKYFLWTSAVDRFPTNKQISSWEIFKRFLCLYGKQFVQRGEIFWIRNKAICWMLGSVRQSMIVCRGWVSKRGKYLTAGRLTNIVDKFWQTLMRVRPANIVVKCQQILSQSFTWGRPVAQALSWNPNGLLGFGTALTVCMVKHSFHMSIDSKGISTVEWKCQQQKSRLVPQSSL